MPDDVPLSRILAALERAARYRRSLANGPGVNAVTLQNDIVPIRGRPVLHVNRDGWAEIGTVSDRFAGCLPLAVWWHPATDRVQVERPPAPKPPPVPTQALYRSHPAMGGTASTPPPFIALPGFVFTFAGRDYSPAEAERLAAEQGCMDGWTWRREPDAPAGS